jgi:hypothetical protein
MSTQIQVSDETLAMAFIETTTELTLSDEPG